MNSNESIAQPLKKFQRYEITSTEDSGIRMPKDQLDAKSQILCIGELLNRLEDFNDAERAMFPWADRFVMGYPLPKWQRPLVWWPEQKVRFIESIWGGIDIGSYMINDVFEYDKKYEGEKGRRFREFSDVILDGQQRLSAIEDYVLDRFAVNDSIGVGRLWSDLPVIERRRFCGFHFARSTIKSWDEAALRKAYDLRAFGGTPHTEDQRAS
jgi:hypothetical protein